MTAPASPSAPAPPPNTSSPRPSSNSRSPPTPHRPASTPTGWPLDADGPLVVFSYRVREQRDPERPWITWPVIAIVTYDAAAGRELGRFELSERLATVHPLGISGTELLIDRDRIPPEPATAEHGVYAYNLAGEELRRVTDVFAGTDGRPILSPDGRTLAGASAAGDDCPDFVLCTAFAPVGGPIDDTEPLIYPNPDLELEPLAWRDDLRSVLAWHLTRSESPGNLYLVTDEGETSEVGPFATVAPGGHHMADATDPRLPWRANAFGCDIYDTVTIYDIDTAAPIATVGIPGISIPGQSAIDWSPDGRTLLATGHATPEDTTEGCLSAARQWRQTPRRAFRHDLDTGTTTEVPDPNALRAAWHGSPLISTRCLDTETVALPRASGRWIFPAARTPTATSATPPSSSTPPKSPPSPPTSTPPSSPSSPAPPHPDPTSRPATPLPPNDRPATPSRSATASHPLEIPPRDPPPPSRRRAAAESRALPHSLPHHPHHPIPNPPHRIHRRKPIEPTPHV